MSYVTKPIVRQTLVLSVTASGTVNPQNTVTVGTQVSGIISQLYVDFNSKVKMGEVLARIDPSSFQSQLDQATAASRRLERARPKPVQTRLRKLPAQRPPRPRSLKRKPRLPPRRNSSRAINRC